MPLRPHTNYSDVKHEAACADISIMATRHFILTNDGSIEEFSEEEASQVASGSSVLSQFADSRLRYVQVAFEEETDRNGELKVRTMGAVITFDGEGRVNGAGSPSKKSEALSRFEHDACVQFALRDTLPDHYALN